jgi:hypothetical protein
MSRSCLYLMYISKQADEAAPLPNRKTENSTLKPRELETCHSSWSPPFASGVVGGLAASHGRSQLRSMS